MKYQDNNKNNPVPLEIALSLCDSRSFQRRTCAKEGMASLEPVLRDFLNGHSVTRIHLGNEFCENLIPFARQLEVILTQAADAGLNVTLVTPMLTDHGIQRLRPLLVMLPANAEVVANDWGLLRLLARDFPALEAVAGRQLCKMTKDPRTPSPLWARVNPPIPAPELLELLKLFAVKRMELDVPPFAQIYDFKPNGMSISVHAPLGYALMGRICKIGSLKLKREKKFSAANACGKECLTYMAKAERQNGFAHSPGLPTFQRGNALFYRYSPAQCETLMNAVEEGWINRIILAGDWNENNSTN